MRSAVRRTALVAMGLAAVWIVAVVVTGGFAVSYAGLTFSSREPMRPLYWGSLPLALYVWANGAAATARAWSFWTARVDHRIAAIALTLGVFTIGLAYATTVGNASDAYGYVSQADLWLRSDLRLPQPWSAAAPWPDAERTFAPLAYRPAGTGDSTDLVPVYSPGLPLLMAAAKGVAGHRAMFLVVPLAGAVLVLATWGIGTRLGSSAAGVIAAWFVATSPAFLFMLPVPMSDVPVAACWAVMFYSLLRPGAASGFGAGVAAGLAILIRPNLVWLAVPPGMWLLWRNRSTPGVGFSRLLGFSVGVVAAVAFIAIVNARLYGSPLQSGYGDLGPAFAWSHGWINARKYFAWLVESQTTLIVIGLLAVIWPARRLWPHVTDRSFFWVVGACVVGLWIFYFFYWPFDDWWYLRFLLMSWPFIMLGLAAAIVALSRTGSARSVFCAWLIVVFGVRSLNDARARGAFELWRGDRETVAAALATRDTIPATSVVFSELHSGSLRYYGGRMTLEYSWLERDWLDRAVAWLDQHGAPSYALLSRDEARAFKARFAGAMILSRFDAPPVFVYPESGLALYALSAPFAGDTRALTFDPHELRSVPPVDFTLINFPFR